MDTTQTAPRLLTPRAGDERPHPALVIVWHATRPDRVGEWASLPVERVPHELGRGPGAPGAPRLVFGAAQEPLSLAAVSRRQLEASWIDDGLEVANHGRCALLVNGRACQTVRLRAGDTIQLRNQLVLMLAMRSGAAPAFPPLSTDPAQAVGRSPAWQAVTRQIEWMGPQPGHVLITGPSGSGKELVARALFKRSGRSPWIARNAAALPESLLDAELFGNLAGYPNPGMPARPGLIGAADGGVLFLDEIAEMPAALQAHLLRVLDADGEYQRLGDARMLRSDLRVIAATNRPIDTLKHDLAARFPLRLAVPGLDARREDIPLIAAQLLRRMPHAARFLDAAGWPRLAPDLVEWWLARPWPDAVRGLHAHLLQCIAASDGPWLDRPPEPMPAAVPKAPALEVQAVQDALRAAAGNRSDAARRLGISRHALRRFMQKHGIVDAP